jgi:hypothetical protein
MRLRELRNELPEAQLHGAAKARSARAVFAAMMLGRFWCLGEEEKG